MQINGLPLHPIAVHAAVVFIPLTALVALGYLVPQWRDRLRWPLLVSAVIAFGSFWITYLSGEDLLEARPYLGEGEIGQKVAHHHELADQLKWIASLFSLLAIVTAGFLHRRTGALRGALSVLLAIGAIASVIWAIRVGDAGAQAVWGQ